MENNNNINKNMYVAFLDILGFSDLVMKKGGYEIYQIFKGIQCKLNNSEKLGVSRIDKEKNKILKDLRSSIKTKIISDSIILYIDSTKKCALDYLILACLEVQKYLYMEHSILIRGGVSEGEVWDEGEIFFGKGIINAYNLERQAAYPRIIIDPRLFEDISDKEGNITSRSVKKIGISFNNSVNLFISENLSLDYDKNTVFINYFNDFNEYFGKIDSTYKELLYNAGLDEILKKCYKDRNKNIEDEEEINKLVEKCSLDKICDYINCKNNSLCMKYNWLRTYIDYMKNEFSEVQLELYDYN